MVATAKWPNQVKKKGLIQLTLSKIKAKVGAINVLKRSNPKTSEKWEFCSVWFICKKSFVLEIEYILKTKPMIMIEIRPRYDRHQRWLYPM